MNDPERTPAPASASTRTGARRSSLGLMVLWQLVDEPMHVYRMQKLFEQQGKDRVVNVRARASLYQTLERLMRLGLVEVHETVRREGYPDRIVYAITDAGREVAREWLREMLRTTGDGTPTSSPPSRSCSASRPRMRAPSSSCGPSGSRASSPRPRRSSPRTPACRGCSCSRRSTGARSCTPSSRWLRGVIADLARGRLTWSEEWLHGDLQRIPPTRRPRGRR